jgi:hypothetical protein
MPSGVERPYFALIWIPGKTMPLTGPFSNPRGSKPDLRLAFEHELEDLGTQIKSLEDVLARLDSPPVTRAKAQTKLNACRVRMKDLRILLRR